MKLLSFTLFTYILAATATHAVASAETKRGGLVVSSSDILPEGRQLHPRKQLSKRMINNPLSQNSNRQKEEVDRAFEELARLIVPESAAVQSFSRPPFMRPALNQPGPYDFRRPLSQPPFLPRPLHPPHGPPPPPSHSPSAPPPPKASEEKKENKEDKDDSSDKEEAEDKEESEGKKKEEEKEEEESEGSKDGKKEKEEA